MRVRVAEFRDHDNLAALFKKSQTSSTSASINPYYLAPLIETKRVLVAEEKRASFSETYDLVGFLTFGDVPDEPDAFSIDQACFEASHQNQSRDLLLAAFGMYPERNWVVVVQPTAAPVIPMLRDFHVSISGASAIFRLHRAAAPGLDEPTLGLLSAEPASLQTCHSIQTQHHTIGEIAVSEIPTRQVASLAEKFDLEQFVAAAGGAKFLRLERFSINEIFARHSVRLLHKVLQTHEALGFLSWEDCDFPCLEREGVFAPVPRRRAGNILGMRETETGGFLKVATGAALSRGPKLPVTARIVVVGRGSETGSAVVEGLNRSPWCRFLAVHVLPRDKHVVGLSLQGNVKKVCVRGSEGEEELEFDRLILAEDLQDVTALAGKGCMRITDEKLEELLDEKIQSLRWNPLAKAVVYGGGLDGLGIVQKLLSKGVPGDKITLALTPKDVGNSDNAIRRGWEEAKTKHVQVLETLGLEGLDRDKTLDKLRWARFKGGLRIPCRVFVGCAEKDICPQLHAALEAAGVVFDGRIIVDAAFRTSCPAVWASGSVSMFSKTLRPKGVAVADADEFLRHENLNSRETGARLASSLAIGCLEEAGNVAIIDQASLTLGAPLFSLPLVAHGVVPGGLRYCRAFACGMHRTREDELLLSTDTTALGGRLFELRISGGRVQEAVYLGKSLINVQALISLVGLREEFLNKIAQRFQAKLIPDLLDFLCEDWSKALFHDRFPDMVSALMERTMKKEGMPLSEGEIKATLVAFLTHHRKSLDRYHIPDIENHANK